MALRNVRKWSGGPPAMPTVVGDPPAVPEVVGGPPAVPEVFEGLCGRDGSCRGALQLGRKWSVALRQSRKCLGGSAAGPEVVGKPFGQAAIGLEALRQGWKWSGGPPAGLEVVGGPSGGARIGRGDTGTAESGQGTLR